MNASKRKYAELDNFLRTGMSPEEIGHELDETLCDLVHYAGKQEEYVQELPNRYFLIKKLRDIFWKLEKEK